jgi:hypothetical protein
MASPWLQRPVGGCSGFPSMMVTYDKSRTSRRCITSPTASPWLQRPVGGCSDFPSVMVIYNNPVGVSAVCNGSTDLMVTYNDPVGVRVAYTHPVGRSY